MTEPRAVVAVVLPASSPVARASAAVHELGWHLPHPAEPDWCAVCHHRRWPCAPFHVAAADVHAAGLRIGDFVPVELHTQLWPPPQPQPRD